MSTLSAGSRPRKIAFGFFTALLLLLIAGCGGGGHGDSTHGQPSSSAGAQQSTNWSGYVQTGPPQSFTRVGGTWTVPAVQCSGSQTTRSATWTGIGGGTTSDPTLVQAGTEQDCNGGPSYSAWWEVIPAPATTVSGGTLGSQNFDVQPGDQITVTLDGSSAAVWNITIQNASRGWTFNTTVPYGSAGATAEWIEEAPLSAGSGGAGQSSLSNYGSAGFTSLSANGTNPHLTSGERVAMVDSNGTVISNPSAPGTNGDAFDVCFGSGVCQ